MEKKPVHKKSREATKEELLQLDKEELVEKIMEYQAYNAQLENIINKNMSESNGTCNFKRKRKFDFTKCHFRRVFLHLMYFGWDYQGFVVQETSTNTIEHHLFNALTKACLIESRELSRYHRCGRTDKGVSAFAQVISITLRSKHPPEDQHKPESLSSEIPYCHMLNRLMPKEIKAISWMPIPADKPDYSARFDCKRRQYKYYFPRSALNVAAMRDACGRLVGLHDYRHLCKMDVGNGVVQFTREIHRAEILAVGGRDDDEHTAMYCLVIEGNAFLWHQIRCIMGVLLLVGEGQESPEVVAELLDVEKNHRKPQYHMALDVPLNLFHCSYELEESNVWIFDRCELRQIISDLQREWTLHNVKTTMINDCLRQLDAEYKTLCEKETHDDNKRMNRDRVIDYTKCLTQGVRTKIYKPLFERQTCASLEERIEYYKRRKTNRNIQVDSEQAENSRSETT